MTCYTYLIRCNNDSLYCGMANDAISRWKAHEAGTGARYIKIHGFCKPVYLERHPDKPAARKREISIKKLSKDEKEKLIESPKNLLKKLNLL